MINRYTNVLRSDVQARHKVLAFQLEEPSESQPLLH